MNNNSGFKYEHILKYIKAGATSYDCDTTLIAIREIETNKKWIAKNCNHHFTEESWDKFYKECCSTIIRKDDLNMRYVRDAVQLALLDG